MRPRPTERELPALPQSMWFVLAQVACMSFASAAAAQSGPSPAAETLDRMVAAAKQKGDACDAAEPSTSSGVAACRDAGVTWVAVADLAEQIAGGVTDAGRRLQLLARSVAARNNAATCFLSVNDCMPAFEAIQPLMKNEAPASNESLAQQTTNAALAVRACFEAHPAAEQPPATAQAPSQTLEATPLRATGAPTLRQHVFPGRLAFAGLVAVAGAAGWDAAQADDRKTFNDLKATCSGSTGPDCDAYDQARQRLSDARLPITLLYGAGATALVSSVLWWLIGESPPAQTQLSIGGGPGLFGVQATFQW